MDRTDLTNSATYIVEPITTHTYTVILLHGLSSNGRKFGSEFLETGKTSAGRTLQQLLPGARFIFPTAKRRRSSAFGRATLTQWFDIARLSDPEYRKEIQLQGLAESAAELHELLQQETSKVSPQNIIIGGISQGCAMSLSLLLTLSFPLGGYIGMCGYLPFRIDIEEAIKENDIGTDEDDPFTSEEALGDAESATQGPAVKALIFERELLCLPPITNDRELNTAKSTPVFLGHGDMDEKKPLKQGEAAAKVMRAAEYEVVWKVYHGLGHWYRIPDEIDDIVDFIRVNVGWTISEE